MALIKSKTLENGATGNYFKVVNYSVNRPSKKLYVTLDLFKDETFKDKESLNYKKNFCFDVLQSELSCDMVALCYNKVKARASTVRFPAVPYQAAVPAVPASDGDPENGIPPTIGKPAKAEVPARPAVYWDDDLFDAVDDV